jgi:hypothetical protein
MWVCGLITAALLGACASESKQGQMAVQALPILEEKAGRSSGIEQLTVELINSDKQLKKIGGKALADMNVNFQKRSVLVAGLGRRPTQGYWIRIRSVQQQGPDLYVVGQANRPGENAQVAQQVTQPYHAVVIPKTEAQRIHPEFDSLRGKEPGEMTKTQEQLQKKMKQMRQEQQKKQQGGNDEG